MTQGLGETRVDTFSPPTVVINTVKVANPVNPVNPGRATSADSPAACFYASLVKAIRLAIVSGWR
eukprot:6955434-Pyramimonas_sp.AAC.1